MRKIHTLWDARNARVLNDVSPGEARAMARAAQAAALETRNAAVLALNPQIGVLMREGRKVYYVATPEAVVEDVCPVALMVKAEALARVGEDA